MPCATAESSKSSSGSTMTADLLAANALETGYGKLQVLWGSRVAVREGETVVLLGANGAGKTTLLKVMMGLMPAWRGEVRYQGRDITHERTDRRVKGGIAYMSERNCFQGSQRG